MAEQPSQVDTLFEKLDKAIASGSHEKAVKVADNILKLEPGDQDALGCKLVALIQAGQFDAALQLINSKALEADVSFEKAYCFYRTGKLQEALKCLDAVPAERAGEVLQLQAQLHFRLGNETQCVEAYKQLTQDHKVESAELQANILAAYVAGHLAAQLPQVMSALKISPRASFEVTFNTACGLLQLGDLAGAEAELRAGLKIGREALFEEDFTEEEVEEELAPLTAQLAFIAGRQGKSHAAVEAYHSLLDPSRELQLDAATAAVATHNLAAENYLAESYQAAKKAFTSYLKKLDGLFAREDLLALKAELEGRLSREQRLAMGLSRGLLNLQLGKVDVARKLVAALGEAFPKEQAVVLLRAALLAKDNKAADADALLASTAAADPSAAQYPLLMRVQLALDSSSPQQALQLLASPQYASLANAPAVLATRVALCESTGDQAAAEALLSAAVQHWQQQAKQGADGSAEAVDWCMGQLVGLRLKLGKAREAAQSYQQLSSRGGKSAASVGVLAKLIRATAAAGDTATAEVLQKELPAAPSTAGLDVGTLEDSSRAVGGGVRRELHRKREATDAGDEEQPKKKSKRKKKKRLPKGFDASKPDGGLPAPDPERWLPKWERSEFKKRKARRNKDAVKGSQGAGKVDENLDRTKVVVEDKPESSSKGGKPTLPPKKSKGKR